MLRIAPLGYLSISVLLFSGLCAEMRAAPADRLPGDGAPAAAEPSTPADVYGEGVRSTPWRTAAEQRAGFHLPAGFEVKRFASEPEIAKPLNMAFDAKGRLWLTQSTRYPYAADHDAASGASGSSEPAGDAVVVLSDTDGDGRADSVTRFAEDLNIPIGVLPYGDGCICFSIPNLWYLRDTNGDGRCDTRERLYGPFDTTRDTHGMVNALRDGGDGWIYACHGFNNQSTVAGSDGHAVTMHSGNTFRFRPDGSRIELYTRGQVNPFGLTRDAWGYFYSADCHSKPITQLISGACYPSFGRPHDGLGFLPPMVDHLHGSTAISGITFVPPDSPWRPLRNQILSGNVMTSRLNRNAVTYRGATAVGVEQPDFMTSDDPWFRPVDLRFGPDGALYVADFYNKIIGHYEVPLDHPGRDRTSGRIWRIEYTAAKADAPAAERSVFTDPLAALTSGNPFRRRLAVAELTSNQLSDAAADRLTQAMRADHRPAAERVAILKVLSQMRPASVDAVAVAKDPAAPLRRALFAQLPPSDAARSLAHDALADPNPHVVQAAARWLGAHGSPSAVATLLGRLTRVREDDPVLRQTLRIAIARRLREAPSDWPGWSPAVWPADRQAELLGILPAVERPEAMTMLLAASRQSEDPTLRAAWLRQVIDQGNPQHWQQAIELARQIAGDRREQQWAWLEQLWQSPQRPSGPLPPVAHAWLEQLVAREWDESLAERMRGQPWVGWHSDRGGPWPTQPRPRRGGGTVTVSSSIIWGESYTGAMSSDPFPAPEAIRFWLAGHNGLPAEQDHQKNRVQLIDASSGEILRSATPPRSDTADSIEWSTADLAGRMVRLKCVDGDDAGAYAWLAIGDFEPAYLNRFAATQQLDRWLTWIERGGLTDQTERLRPLLRSRSLPIASKLHAARALARLREASESTIALLSALHAQPEAAGFALDSDQREAGAWLAACVAGEEASQRLLAQAFAAQLPATGQKQFVIDYLRSGGAGRHLLPMLTSGQLSASHLTDDAVWQMLSAKLDDDGRLAASALRDLARARPQAKDERLARLQQAVAPLSGDAVVGATLYKTHCANCHQLRGQGEVIGPQLDGAITRPRDRLLEDITMPHRNVDRAFRSRQFVTVDGQVKVGLVRSESDTAIQLVDIQGKPFQLRKEDIEQQITTNRSLMPDNFAELLTPRQLADLIRHLKAGS